MSFFRADMQQLDLSRLHYECERNFQRLSKIPLDTLELGTMLQVRFKGLTTCAVQFKVIEVTRYTSTLAIVANGRGLDWLPDISLKARSYRDAKMFEVIEWCSDRTIPWVLSESKGMQARDEKWQWNVFLSELLTYSLRHGAFAVETP